MDSNELNNILFRAMNEAIDRVMDKYKTKYVRTTFSNFLIKPHDFLRKLSGMGWKFMVILDDVPTDVLENFEIDTVGKLVQTMVDGIGETMLKMDELIKEIEDER